MCINDKKKRKYSRGEVCVAINDDTTASDFKSRGGGGPGRWAGNIPVLPPEQHNIYQLRSKVL